MFSYAYTATLCRAISPSLSSALSFLSLDHSLFLSRILLRRFYPEAKLGSCYNLTSTFLSPVTAAFARMHKSAFLSSSSRAGRFLLISSHDHWRSFFSPRSFFPLHRGGNGDKKVRESSDRANESMMRFTCRRVHDATV